MSQPRTWRSLGHRVSADVQIRTGQKPDQRQPPYELSKVLGVPVAFFFEGIEGTDEGADTEARQSGAIAMTGRTRLPGGEPRKANPASRVSPNPLCASMAQHHKQALPVTTLFHGASAGDWPRTPAGGPSGKHN